MNPSLKPSVLSLLFACSLCGVISQAAETLPRDLTPVTMLSAPPHAAVEIVRDGVARAVVYVAVEKPSPKLRRLVAELIEVVRLSTGATLDVVTELPKDVPLIAGCK